MCYNFNFSLVCVDSLIEKNKIKSCLREFNRQRDDRVVYADKGIKIETSISIFFCCFLSFFFKWHSLSWIVVVSIFKKSIDYNHFSMIHLRWTCKHAGNCSDYSLLYKIIIVLYSCVFFLMLITVYNALKFKPWTFWTMGGYSSFMRIFILINLYKFHEGSQQNKHIALRFNQKQK